jgi:hypothetical protein
MKDRVANWHIITVGRALRYDRQRAFPAGCDRVAFNRCQTQDTNSYKTNGQGFHLALLLSKTDATLNKKNKSAEVMAD